MTPPKLRDGTDKVIQHFLAEKLRKAGAKGYVLGVSGGVDSAVVLKLAVNAVGADRVLGLLMPEKDSPKEDMRDAEELCRALGVGHEVIDITGAVEALAKAAGAKADRMALANIKARCRMILLYNRAGTQGRLVLGTSNKSEMLVGYFTKHGDGAADLEPIGDLYKTEVWELARVLGLPEKLIAKAPSAGLWKGQTDEGEMGIAYARLDAILHGIEQGLPEADVARRAGATEEEVARVSRMVRMSSHKRKFPAVAKVGLRTPGLDWREGDEDV